MTVQLQQDSWIAPAKRELSVSFLSFYDRLDEKQQRWEIQRLQLVEGYGDDVVAVAANRVRPKYLFLAASRDVCVESPSRRSPGCCRCTARTAVQRSQPSWRDRTNVGRNLCCSTR